MVQEITPALSQKIIVSLNLPTFTIIHCVPLFPQQLTIIGSCNTKTVIPAFTNSTQAIVPANTNIVVQPTSGTATVNSTTGQITYTPNPGLTTDVTDSIYLLY